jgi:dTDP-4-amino-4,6-dideoxygalactose transaminase
MDKILSIAKEKGIILLEDCSHAHGATYNGKKVGTFGEAAVFSIQGQKTLTGGEGGVLLTDHEEIYYRSLLLGHHNKRCHQEIPTEHPLSKYSTTGMGLKFRIHPLAAAIANEQLDNLDKILSGRRKFAHHIYEKLDGLKEIKLPKVPPFVQPSWYALTFSFIGNSSGLSDADFYRNVKERGAYEIDRPKSTCPLYWLPLFRTPSELFPFYQKKFRYSKNEFLNAEKLYRSLFKIPVWHQEKDFDTVEYYIDSILESLR